MISVAAAMTIVGSIVFLFAAFLPMSRVFVERSPARRLEMINASRAVWMRAQALFGLGAALVAAGLAVAAVGLGSQPSWLAYAAAAALVVGATAWAWHLYLRARDPAGFVHGEQPAWPLITYFTLTPLGLAALGFTFLGGPLPDWVGWMLIGTMAFFLVLTAVLRDIAPFVYYVPTLVVGVMLLTPAQ